MKKKLQALLALALALSLSVGSVTTALAVEPDAAQPDGAAGGMTDLPSGEMPGEMPGGEMPGGGGGGSGSAGQEFATYEEIVSSALVTVGDGAVQQAESGIEVSEGGSITESGMTGVTITGGELSNGLAVSLDTATDKYVIEDSTITVDAAQGNNDKGYEAVYGVGVAIETGELWIENSSISANGPRSTTVYGFSNSGDEATSLVVLNSTLTAHSDELWMPSFKLLAGGARASLLMTRNNSWFFDSTLESNNWGALSQDSVDAYTYFVDSTAITTEGGYGAYLTYGLRMYGSTIAGGQYGLFLCGSTDVVTDLSGAVLEDEAAMSKLTENNIERPTGEGVSVICAPFNAIVVHNSLPSITDVATAEFHTTIISTETEDLPENVTAMNYDDEFFLPGTDILGSGAGCGAAYFYNRNLYGSAILVRSMNADFTLDSCTVNSSNGVLLQSVVTYDPPSASGYLTPDEGSTVPGITLTLETGSYEGDILHQDYQRGMTVTVEENASLSGAVVSGTYAAWNDLWTEESLSAALSADGYGDDGAAFFDNADWVADVQANLVRSEDTVYADTENLGVDLTVSGTWEVTGSSSLNSLTLGENGSLTAPEGKELAIYIGCEASNSALSYEGGTLTETLEPGKTYENVRIELADSQPAQTVSFTDVAESDYYYDAVLWAAENGITSGTSETEFSPLASCTRAQVVTFLWRLAGKPESSASVPFTDVAADAYYASAVAWAVEKGITSGTSETTFDPEAIVTRAQFVTFLWRYEDKPAAGTASSFTDVPADAYYTEAVAWAAEKGITLGTSATTFGPDDSCTRGQVVTFLYRAEK